jgi:riboflavin biosynthesis pyrimidine reductase
VRRLFPVRSGPSSATDAAARSVGPGAASSAAAEVDVAAAYADPRRRRHDGRPWLLVNMIASVDGASALEGRSGGLGGPGDRAVFAVLRAIADAILVGASTARTEGYGPPKKPGQRIAVVTRSGQLDWTSALFTSGAGLAVVPEDVEPPPVPAIRAGRASVDLRAALGQLEADVVLAEGGPSLNGQLLAAHLVDELCLTVAPILAGGDARRIVVGDEAVTDLELVHLLEEDGFLFCRYVRAGALDGS